MHPLESDDRALGLAIMAFFAMITIAALMFILLDPAIGQLAESATADAEHDLAKKQIELAKKIWGSILFAPLLVAVMFIIARATVESREPGGGGGI